MSHFVTYDEMVDFFNKKTLQEEAEPDKAKQNQSSIQKLLKKYAKKGFIHTGKSNIAPTDIQWRNILTYHKNKLLKSRVTPVRTLRGLQPDNVKIRECEDHNTLARRMRKWAKELEETHELNDISRVLKLMPTPSSKSDTLKTQVLPVITRGQKQSLNQTEAEDRQITFEDDWGPITLSEFDEEGQKERSKTEEDLKQTQMSKADYMFGEFGKKSGLYPTSELNALDRGLLQEMSTPCRPPPPYNNSSTNFELPNTSNTLAALAAETRPKTHPALSPAGTASSDNSQTHIVESGTLSLIPLKPSKEIIKIKDDVQDVKQQIQALTSIVETDMNMRRPEPLSGYPIGLSAIPIINEAPAQTFRKTMSDHAQQVKGTFTGIVDTDNYENVFINGIVDPHSRVEQTIDKMLPLRTTDNQHFTYEPFSIKDWDALLLKLPSITKGGIPWLRSLLKATAGDILCFSDIHAALTKALDEPAADSIKTAVQTKTNIPMRKLTPLSNFRTALEEVLKTRFPCIVTDELTSLEMKKDEDYYTYKQRAKDLYHNATGEPIKPGTPVTVMFYSTLVKGMPTAVQDALEDVDGLFSKSEDEFDSCCNRRIKKYHKGKMDDDDKQKAVNSQQQALEVAALKLQVQKLQAENKNKQKERTTKVMNMMPKTPEENTPLTKQHLADALQTALQQQPPQMQQFPAPAAQQRYPLQLPLPSMAAAQDRHRPNLRGRGRGGRYVRGRPTPNGNNMQRPCFICGEFGHWSKQCPQRRQAYLPPPIHERVMNVGNLQDGRDTHGCFDEYGDCDY